MKLVIVILLLIAVSFVAVMVYGVTREEPAAAAGPPPGDGEACRPGPPPMDGDEADEEALEDWCKPNFGAFVDRLRARFGPKVKVDRSEVALEAMDPEFVQVREAGAQGEDIVQVARIALVSGRSAVVSSRPVEGDGRTLCLCRPGMPLVAEDFGACKARWLAKQRRDGCRDGSEGSLTFGAGGGSLRFEAARSARLEIR